MTNNGIFVETETPNPDESTKSDSLLKRIVKGIGLTVLVVGLALILVGGMLLGGRAIIFADKDHSYERSEVSELDYALTTSKNEKTYFVNGKENGLYFCERVDGWTECLNSSHTVRLSYTSTRGNSFHKPQLEIVGTDVVYRLACNVDKDGNYCVPVEYTV